MADSIKNPPIGKDQNKILEILEGYGFDRIQFIQPWSGNSNLIVRYGYWQEITGADVMVEVSYVYPEAYKWDERCGDTNDIHTLVLE